MKQLLLINLSFVLVLAACTKHNDAALPEDYGCIERIDIPVTAHDINSADVATVNHLFAANGINYSQFRYYQYTHDIFQTLFPPYAVHDEKIVRVEQYANGLRIFNQTMVFDFFDDQFHFKGGYFSKGTNLNTIPTLNLGQLKKLFLDDLESFDHKGVQYHDSCFKAEFGYFNLNAGTGDTTENLVKAWHLTPRHSDYPEAYYQENAAGERIYYFNGRVYFH